jgi:hypothetical protein
MPVNTTDLMQNIYDLFTGIYATSSGSSARLAFEKLGVPISTTMFKLNQADTALSPALAVERLSEIAGAVMQLQGDSVYRSNRTVEAVTELMLQQSMPATPDVMAALGAAKNAEGKRFDSTRASLEGEFRFHPAYASPADWYDPTATVWTPHKVGQHDGHSLGTQVGGPPVGRPLEPPPQRPPANVTPPVWRVLPNEMQPALQTPGPRAGALTSMVQAKPAGAAAVMMHPPTAVMSRQVPKAAGGMLVVGARPMVMAAHPMVITANPAPMVAHPAAFAATSPMQYRPLMVAQVAAQVNATATTQKVSTDSLDISFEHCVVTLNWPWFPQIFTMLRNWFLPGYARADISNGSADGGLMPLLPSGFVAVRNLTIVAQWSEADLAAVQASASFGPFSLLGRSFEAGTGALTAPGTQIIGWFCEALPVLPPLSDPIPLSSGPAVGTTAPSMPDSGKNSAPAATQGAVPPGATPATGSMPPLTAPTALAAGASSPATPSAPAKTGATS